MKCSCGCEFDPVIEYKHFIICGDCREPDTWKRLLATAGVEKADACITDPPYGMNWDADSSRFSGGKFGNHPKGRKRDNVIGDNMPFDPSPFLDFPVVVIWGMNHFCDRLQPGGVFVWMKRPSDRFGTFLSDCELAWTNTGHGVYAFYYKWRGFIRDGECGEFLHPTQKPVALIQWVIEKSKAGNVVYDPFGGSGTTMIACQNLGRRCLMCEISPLYVAVTLQRMLDASGIEPRLVEGGAEVE
jgi:site-specific DNA-methyltransferase (adenine-specific)